MKKDYFIKNLMILFIVMNKENIKIYNGFQNCSKGVNLDFKVGRVVDIG